MTSSKFDAVKAQQQFGNAVSNSHQPGCASAWSCHLEDPRNGASKQYWTWFDFKPWRGKVTVEADGFHWSTTSYDDGSQLLSGITDSLFEAWQSVTQNKMVMATRCTVRRNPLMQVYGGKTSGQYVHSDSSITGHEVQVA